ncbi:hypothetical protein [Paenibacillus alkalitolerans]|uniref:hypothetical protein n=1 Tax=Paenibacillus alkalitolerans TaxID=2799335 RepID=UPI0018F48AAB|nr:hypothetical protein [Paenibacillus alkalitolerans]
MTNIVLRPDLKTSGGEIHDILINGRYAGNITLVYREGDRVGGSVQLDRTSISAGEKKQIDRYVRNYIQDVIMAVRAADCDVVVTNSPYDHIISTGTDELGQAKVMDDADETGYANDYDFDDYDDDMDDAMLFDYDDDEIGDEDAEDLDRIEMRRNKIANMEEDAPDERDAAYYELVIVGEQRNKVEYHVYDHDMDWVAEAFFQLRGTECFGEIDFKFRPSDEEIEAVTDLIVSDFDEEAVDEFRISVKHKGEELEQIELTHEDLLDTPEIEIGRGTRDEDFIVSLARDDGDMLTYEIYDQARGGLPIGTATVDIASRQLSGFIEFREACTDEEREIIATLLMRELDKEKEYKELNLSVLHQNRKIDELHFESEQVH